MEKQQTFDLFKATCDELRIEFVDKDGIISFKQRKSTSEGTRRFEGYCVESTDHQNPVVSVEAPNVKYLGSDITKAVEALRTGKFCFDQIIEL